MESSHSQVAKSLQNLLQIVDIYTSTCRLRARSLPNIAIPPLNQDYLHHHPSAFNSGSIKKHHHKILKKTWDKVKTAIIHTTSHSNRRASLLNNKTKLDSNSKASNLTQQPSCSLASSAPSTPLHKQTFDFENRSSASQNANQIPQFGLEQPQTNLNCRPYSRSDFLRSISANAGEMKSQENDGESQSRPSCCGERDNSTQNQNMEIQQNYAKLQKRLSEELHQRMSEHKPDTKTAIENLSEDFKKRLRQWEMWRLSTGKVTYTDEELQQILPLDFSQKLHEWETIKTSGIHSHGQHSKTPDSIASTSHSHTTPTPRETSSPEIVPSTRNKLLRKKKNSSECSRQKELAWLEKQLEKIEVEKKYLTVKMKKYMEREARLEKMKQALQNTSPSEVWIRTPTAKCKVEKLTEKFTKKLYQWEEMQGIQPESSTMALLHPKYYYNDDQEDAEIESRVQQAFNSQRYDDDTPAVSSARESESRQEYERESEDIEIEGVCDGEDDVTEHEQDNEYNQDPQNDRQRQRISSESSSDFEEVTDSFATHDKDSNTDSDFYRPEFPSCRRRSSEAISTPLSARSPFTSDDELETCGLLKTVSEENENTNTLKDAESQTEVVLKAKPVVVEDEQQNEKSLGDDVSQVGVFVQTKRTIFTPILDESEPEKVVLRMDGDLKSPSLICKAIQTNQPHQSLPPLEEIRAISPTPKSIPPISIVLPVFSSTSNSFSFAPKTGRMSPISKSSHPNRPSPGLKTTLPRPPPPRIVEVIPKIKSTINASVTPSSCQMPPPRAFPKMGKIPIWCSPLASRRHLGGGTPVQGYEVGGPISDLSSSPTARQHSSSVDLIGTADGGFLGKISPHPPPTTTTTTSIPPSRIPFMSSKATTSAAGGRRHTSASTSTTTLPEESGIVGAAIKTGSRHPAFPIRSSSFRIHRNAENDNEISTRVGNANVTGTKGGFYAQLKSRVGVGFSSSVTKSQSTGSIRSKLGKAFSTFTHKISPKEPSHGHAVEGQGGNNPSDTGGAV